MHLFTNPLRQLSMPPSSSRNTSRTHYNTAINISVYPNIVARTKQETRFFLGPGNRRLSFNSSNICHLLIPVKIRQFLSTLSGPATFVYFDEGTPQGWGNSLVLTGSIMMALTFICEAWCRIVEILCVPNLYIYALLFASNISAKDRLRLFLRLYRST